MKELFSNRVYLFQFSVMGPPIRTGFRDPKIVILKKTELLFWHPFQNIWTLCQYKIRLWDTPVDNITNLQPPSSFFKSVLSPENGSGRESAIPILLLPLLLRNLNN